MEGSLESYGLLARQYYPAITAVAYSILRDRHLAEDTAQEALAQMLGNLPGLRKPHRFNSYLLRIARNTALNTLKKQARYVPIAGDCEPAATVEKNTDNLRENLLAAIARLPRSARELVNMRYFANMTYQQISITTGLTTAAINARLQRARQKLAKDLRSNLELEDYL